MFRPYHAVGVLLLLAFGLVMGLQYGLSDLAFRQAEREVSFWGRGDYVPTAAAIAGAGAAIDRALWLWPKNPDYLRVKSRLLMWRAYWQEDAQVAAELEQRALDMLLLAARLRPAQREIWQELVVELTRLRQWGPTLELAERQNERLREPLPGQP